MNSYNFYNQEKDNTRMCKQLGLHISHNCHKQRHLRRYLDPMGIELHSTPAALTAKMLITRYSYHFFVIQFETSLTQIIELCSLLRFAAREATVIILMPKVRKAIEEKLFDCGMVDDVVVGQQTTASLLAKRIRIHLNRNNNLPPCSDAIRFNDVIVDFDRREVWCDGTIRPLIGIVPDLLRYFLDNANRIISRQELMASPIWADSICSSADEGGKIFDMAIGRLRKAIEVDPANPKMITTVIGAGWRLSTDPQCCHQLPDPENSETKKHRTIETHNSAPLDLRPQSQTAQASL